MNLPELAHRVRVSWNPRMQTTAGRAWWPDRAIELNPKLKSLAPEELWRTLKHELAHLVAYERAGRRHTDAHGPEWRVACADLGIPNEQPFHTLPFKRRSFDRLIAAQELALDVILVTDNEKDFADIPGLKVENWTV